MSSAVKSKDRSSSAGQKFWHLKKLALGKANNNGDQPHQRPPSPAESAYSIDTMSLCDVESPKPRSKRLSVLLSHRRQSGSNNKVSPSKGGMSSAMSVQNIQALSSNTSLHNTVRASNTPTRPSVRQRTMSHTAGATNANDTRAAFLRTRHSSGEQQQQHQPQLSRHMSIKDQQQRGAFSKPHEDDPASNGRRVRGLRPAASLANLKSASNNSRYSSDDQQSPPLSPTSPRSQQQSPVLLAASPGGGGGGGNRPMSLANTTTTTTSRASKPPTPRNSQPPTPKSPVSKEGAAAAAAQDESDVSWSSQEDTTKDDDSLSSHSFESNKGSEEYWQHKLEKERAVVKALQRQKEACNKDITFLSQSVDELSSEKQEWKQKYENEKTNKERIQDDLSSTTDKLNETREQVKMLVTENDQLRTELQDQKRKYEESMQKEKKDVDHEKLQAQLRHSQDQVRVLKATMEQFLRMGIFSEEPSVYQDIASRFSTQLKASPVECIVERQQVATAPPTPPTPAAQTSSSEPKQKDEGSSKNKDKEIKSPADLDVVLRELTREKELLQSEYSKIPISGVNALTRRRKEELEERLDAVDSQMSKTKLKYRDLLKK